MLKQTEDIISREMDNYHSHSKLAGNVCHTIEKGHALSVESMVFVWKV